MTERNTYRRSIFSLATANRGVTRASEKRGGFALVIALVLMAFIVLLLLSLSMATSAELGGSSARNDAEKARQNALLGLSVAIGELQVSLGPDRRTNAPASQKSGVADNRGGWVGVYESWLGSSADRPESPSFVRWLVSGTDEAMKRESTAEGGNIGNTYLGLVGGSDANRVEAGLVSVGGDNSSGAFAWWVGDENAKARVRYEKKPATALSTWLERRQGGVGANPQSLSYASGIDPEDSRLDLGLSHDALTLAGVDAAEREAAFHALTPHSLGVLSNVRSGGLRKDLSFYLEKTEANRPTDALYKLDGRNGVHFGELWAYYNLWRQLATGGAFAHPDGGSLPSTVPVLTGNANAQVERHSPFGVYNRPVLTRFSWLISIQSSLVVVEGVEKYQMQVVLDPIIILWNPYDVSLNVPTGSYMRFQADGLPYVVDMIADGNSLHAGGKSFVPRSGEAKENALLGGNAITLTVGNVAGRELRIRPGEVLVYSGSSLNVSAADYGWNRNGGIVIDFGDPVSGDEILELVTINADPKGRSNGQWNLFLVEESIGGNGGRIAGGFSLDRNNWGTGRLLPEDYPDIFTDIEVEFEDEEFLIKDFEGVKRPVAVFSIGFRTEEDSLITGRFLSRATRAAGGFDLQDLSRLNLAGQGLDISMSKVNSASDEPGFSVASGGQGFFGGGYLGTSGTSYLITQSVPRTPIYSLAAFQHATAGGLTALRWSSPDDINVDFHKRKIEPTVARIIGNSHALPIFGPNETSGETNDGHPAIDHSYHANMALWDDWFFSSISPRESAVHLSAGIDSDQQEVFDAFVSGADFLPNPRMKYLPRGDSDTFKSKLFASNGTPTSTAHEVAAESLLVEGMFNVNSTSVDAWVAMLSALRSDGVAVVDSSGDLRWDSGKDLTPLPSLMLPAEGALVDNDLEDARLPKQWLGYRSFSDAQIRSLATEIVHEVKARGPFLSMADFVNRRVGTNRDLAKSSALQTALDRVVNKPLIDGSRGVSVSDVPSGLPFREAEAGARSTGSPAYVDQADLLTIIGPSLNVRSDTFLIRVYGQTSDSNGLVTAAARGEAVVQRIPEYVDSAQEPRAAFAALNQINQRFGRQLKVVSFRWLSDDEI